jgi:hypothetical protein
MIPKKRVVVVHWKNKPEDPFEVFSSLKNFCLSYEDYNYNTLSNYLSKGKIAYDNQQMRIERKLVILKPKNNPDSAAKRSIVPVGRKVLLHEADDAKKDMNFWLSKSPLNRISAVTDLISDSMKRSKRLDKKKIVKRKLKA